MKMKSSKVLSRVVFGACLFWKTGDEHSCITISGGKYKLLVIRRCVKVL